MLATFTHFPMSDPQREQASSASDPTGATRDARIEELLLTGLDHYFSGRHSEAINVWTRVLFLDRSHARARAYIERARSAIAEGQRESDELLQRGMAAFQEGEAQVARRLLTRAAERAGSQQEEALALLGRIERLQAAASPEAAAQGGRRRAPSAGGAPIPSERPLLWLAFVVFVAALGTISVLVATHSGRAPSWMALLPGDPPEAAAFVPQPLPTPQPGEVALVRARSLYSRGRLSDALRVLDEVSRGDRVGAEADALRAEIQQMLLESAGARPAFAMPGTAQPGGGR
jgi:hypothetical protein